MKGRVDGSSEGGRQRSAVPTQRKGGRLRTAVHLIQKHEKEVSQSQTWMLSNGG
jgi:hypothetical protein